MAAVTGLLLALAVAQPVPALCSEFIQPSINRHLGWINYSNINLFFNFSAPTIFAYRYLDRGTYEAAGTLKMNGQADDFCGKWQKVGLGMVMLMIVVPVVSLAIFVHLRRARDDRLLGETLRQLPGMPREFGYSEICRATGNFAEANRLGEGAFGKVYRGVLPGTGQEVAVKSFSRQTSRGDFLAELTIINRLRHKNLVGLLGWCYKNKKLLLVYVYMPNRSLDMHLYHRSSETTGLSWERRYNILAGVASALHYLHHEYDQKVVHRDIKSNNILLDSAFNACLGDFGLARAIDNEQTSYEEHGHIPGTWGYIAPECLYTGKATGRSDVYSFGAVMLEVVCGRRPGTAIGGFTFLVDWVWSMYEEGKMLDTVDLGLRGSYDAKEAERLLLLGLACCHPSSGERPKTQSIIEIISKSSPPPPVPLPKPAFTMPSHASGLVVHGGDLYSPIRTFSSSWTPRVVQSDSSEKQQGTSSYDNV